MKALGFHSAASVHVMVEAMRHVYMGRNSYLGDSGLFSNLFNRLLSKDYAAQIRTRIMPGREIACGKRLQRMRYHEPHARQTIGASVQVSSLA